MLTTSRPRSTADLQPTPPEARPSRSMRLPGLGALSFVGVVVLQNLLRGSDAPANDASTAEVLAHFSDHRSLTFVLVATFVVSAVSLATFVGGTTRRLTAGPRPTMAYAGLVGVAGVMALFSVLLASEQAMSVIANGSAPDPSAIAALWALHNSVFTALWLFVGLALLGLGRAGVAAGITPRAFGWLAPVGAGLLAIGCVAGPSIAGSEFGALFALGLVGFLIWLAFLLTTGLRLVRSDS